MPMGYGCRIVSDRTSCANSTGLAGTLIEGLGDRASTSLIK